MPPPSTQPISDHVNATDSTGNRIPDPGRILRVDLEEKRQLDAARQRAVRVKARARPWRPIFLLVLAVIAAAVSRSARIATARPEFGETAFRALGRGGTEALADAAAVTFFLIAALATATLAGRAREVLQPRIGTSHAAIIRYTLVLLGGLATILITLQLFNISVTQLLVGGAVASVVIGIAAQQSLSNVFAGIVLLLARPLNVGDQVWIRSGALGGEFRGTVTEIGITYIRLDTSEGPIHLPNSQVLGAAVAPAGDNTPDKPALTPSQPQRPAAPPQDTGEQAQ
jgi:small-conductance mechanosensitive channel